MFEKWYKALVKAKFGYAALPVAGIGIGEAILQSSRGTPDPYKPEIAWLGVRTMQGATAIFFLSMISYLYFWIRELRQKFAPKRSRSSKGGSR